ncbi:hypothetical protein CCY99_03935 [Helicobacter sp. 16-1353]|nr:hypothetical protein CCY99_03935 [Helicobacter sp. 16-1353]
MNKKVVVIGSTGHIGTYLVPMLVENGFEVIGISRGKSPPYEANKAFDKITKITLDRTKEPDFATKIAALNADVIVDLINFHIDDTIKMVKALKNISHYLFCSSIWAHGRARELPSDPNSTTKAPLDEYGIQKFKSEMYLKEQFKKSGFPASIIMPGQISGAGWLIINPWGNLNVKIFEKIARGEEISLPNWGMETLHHVHAYDVAQMFFKAIMHRDCALGESFHAVAKQSLSLYGYAEMMYEYFNKTPKISFLSWEKWCEYEGNKEEIDHTYFHIARSGHYSIENAQRLIDYKPKYSTQETIKIAIESYIKRGIIKV